VKSAYGLRWNVKLKITRRGNDNDRVNLAHIRGTSDSAINVNSNVSRQVNATQYSKELSAGASKTLP